MVRGGGGGGGGGGGRGMSWNDLCFQNVRFSCFLKRRKGRTYGPTDLRTDRPSYRDARTHLKMVKIGQNLGAQNLKKTGYFA